MALKGHFKRQESSLYLEMKNEIATDVECNGAGSVSEHALRPNTYNFLLFPSSINLFHNFVHMS